MRVDHHRLRFLAHLLTVPWLHLHDHGNLQDDTFAAPPICLIGSCHLESPKIIQLIYLTGLGKIGDAREVSAISLLEELGLELGLYSGHSESTMCAEMMGLRAPSYTNCDHERYTSTCYELVGTAAFHFSDPPV